MRAQSKSVFAYVFRNFWQLALTVLPLAVLGGVFFNFNAAGNFVSQAFNGAINRENFFSGVAKTFIFVRFADRWYVNVFTAAALVLVNSLLIVKISRHMRVGEMPVFPVRAALKLAPAIFLYAVTFFVAVQLLELITLGIVAMLSFIDRISALVSTYMTLSLILELLLSYLFARLLCTFPLVYCDDYRYFRAMSFSLRLTEDCKVKALGYAFAYSMLKVAVTAVATIVSNPFVGYALYTVYYFVFLTFVPVWAFKMYYDATGSDRHDIGNKLF